MTTQADAISSPQGGTSGNQPSQSANRRTPADFVRRRLPWIVAGVAVLFYACTLSNSVSPTGLVDLVKAAGWSWQPIYTEPLQFLLTYPIRWLPAGWQVAGMNVMAALCAAATLGLLARIVAILPHDRTRDQRFMERSEHSWLTIASAWLPPVLAVMACGLQLSFWEHAILGTGEALDLLIFAFVIWSLLEYRTDRKESRLTIAAFVYGIGMTSNFALIAFAPAFVAAVLWIRGLSFFRIRFLVRMVLFGLAGLLLYLLLPLLGTFDAHSDQSFWQSLKLNLGFQKDMLSRFPRTSVNLLLLGLTSLIPAVFIGIKWPASFGDTNAAGTALTNLMMHVIHGLLLVACVAVAFDPQFSPRKITAGMPYSMLPFYFLGAISVGYFAGYFLLVFGVISRAQARHRSAPWRRPTAFGLLINRAITAVLWGALVAVPAGLIYRNFSHIRANTRPYLSQLGRLQAQTLKEIAPQGAIVLSDDPYRLFALDAALRSTGGGDHYVLVDTTSLAWVMYHRHLSERYPQQWLQPPEDTGTLRRLDPGRLVQLIAYLGQSRDIFYLHPSFGYYFEFFYLKPRKLIYQLKPYSTNSLTAPSLTAEEILAQEKFWTDFKSNELSPLLRDMKALQIKDEPNLSLAMAGMIYSRSVNDFAVSLQKAEHLEKAAAWFETSLELNPKNASAYVNRDYNRLLQAGQRENPTPSEGALERLAPYGGDTGALLSANGPVDEPNNCFRVANAFAQGRNFRQAAQQLARVIEFLPRELNAHMAIVAMLNQLQWHDHALARIAQIRSEFPTNVVNSPEELELTQAEAMAYLGRKDVAAAEKILTAAQKTHPKSVQPFSTLAELYVSQNQITNAAKVLDEALRTRPNDPTLLKQYARLKILNGDFAGAVPYLDRALEGDGKDIYALLNRGFANLKMEQLDAAQRDYEALEAFAPDFLSVVYGLHEVHWRKKHPKLATKYGEKFLKGAAPESAEAREIKDRLARIESGDVQ